MNQAFSKNSKESSDFILVSKQELKSLYQKISEYEKIICAYKREKQEYLKLLSQNITE